MSEAEVPGLQRVLIGIGVFFFLCFGAFLFIVMHHWHRQELALQTDGIETVAVIDQLYTQEFKTKRYIAAYSFAAGADHLQRFNLLTELDKRDYLACHVGQRLTILYDPENPYNSVLELHGKPQFALAAAWLPRYLMILGMVALGSLAGGWMINQRSEAPSLRRW
jgi:hypothetical protein